MAISKIRKRDGSIVEFDKDKITNAIFKAAQSVGGSDREESARVADIVVRYISEKFAETYIPTVEEIQDLAEKALIEAGHATTAKSYIIYRHRKNVEREMKKALGVEDDLKLPLNSIQVLEKRYLMKDENGRIVETPSQLFRRVARHLASNELNYGGDEATVKRYEGAFYQIMTNFEFLPNSPTLMNAGTELGQLSACFVLPVKDDIEQIFESVKHQAIIHKTGGGCIIKGSRIFSTFCGAEAIERVYDHFDDGSNVVQENEAFFIDIGKEDIQVPSFEKASGTIAFKPVKKIWKYLLPSDKTMAIRAEGGYSAITSEWHPFFVFDPASGEIVEKRADEIKQNDLIMISNPSISRNWVFKHDRVVEGIELDEQFAWLAGIFSTDGSIDEIRQGLRLRIFSSDEEIIRSALDAIERVTGKRYAVETDYRSKTPVMRLTAYDKGLTDAIKKLNRNILGKKDTTVRIPSDIFKSRLPVIGAYLAGVIDGDGHISKTKPQVEISGASMEFAEDLCALLSLFGIRTRYRTRRDKRDPRWVDMHEVSVSGHTSLSRLAALVLPHIRLARKKERLEQHIRKTHSSTPSHMAFSVMEPFLSEAGINTNNTDTWRRSVRIGGKQVFLARWKEKDRINLNKAITIIEELLKMRISGESKTRLERLLNVLPSLLKVKSTKRNAGGQTLEFYDLTVEGTQNYLAGNMGLSVIHNTGFCFSYLRPKGDYVKSTAGIASGPISFMSAFDNATNVIKQGGKRRGANMATMHVWHPDIEEFVTMKQTPGVMENFNVSVMADDKFMQAVDTNSEYELINPRNMQPIRKVNARSVFKLISYSAWKCAEPGMLFIDEINRHNPTPDEPIHATNPCIAKGAMVTTTEGLTEISKVHNPHHVLTGDGNYHPVRWAGKTGEKDVYLVKTQAGYEVTATADHKFLTEKGWKQADSLGKEDRLVLQKTGQFGKLHVDKEVALMLGWLTGDGHMSKDVQDVIFYFGTDEKEEMLPIFKAYLDRLNDVPVKPRSDGTETRLKYSSRIARMFYELGVRPVKSYEKEVPSSLFSMDEESVRNFLTALFGADGSTQGNRKKGVSIRLASNSLRLLKQVQVLLLQFGVLSAIHENRRKAHVKMLPDSARQPKAYPCRAQHELIISRASMFRFMEKIGFSVSAKDRRFHSLKPENIYSDNIDTSVASVESAGKDEVFDLTEPETHSFSANGLIVHNCGEVPMPDYESCNLGSINLVRFVEIDWSRTDWKKKVDWNRLRYVVRLATQFLDNVIDMNKYPIPQIKEHTQSNRRIGLGVMGFSRMLFKMGIRYDSELGYAVGEQVMKFIQDEARKMSHELGRARGSFPNFKKSPLSSQYDAMRNATCTSIAPTGTISMIANSSSGIEPVFALSFLKTVRAGQYYYCDDVFEHVLKVRGLYSQELMQKIMETGTIQHMDEIPEDVKNVFRVAHDIPPDAHVLMQAAFQKNVDLAVSKTINLPAEATVEDVEAVYLQAWKLGCKGITIYRDTSRSEQVLHIGKTVKTKGVEEDKFHMLQQQIAVAK
ncbi:hypothetical protein H0O00_03200 [Candidatus Micrarchaeota archaeon]|nr:hypothetical protein [Candidatus Micrarchaeota archaeon]